MGLCLSGVAAGLVGAEFLSRLLVSQLYGVQPTDLPTFAMITLILVGVTFVATFVPAWRATRVDPMVALRHE